MRYVYTFTNGKKVTKREFLNWFQKKFLYTIRKFSLINKNDNLILENKKDFRNVVLKDLLKMFSEKSPVELVNSGEYNKKAVADTTDLIAYEISKETFKGNLLKLKKLPKEKKIIRPLYLFLDKEVLLYTKLKDLKFNKTKLKKDKISEFIDSMEKKHKEIKHSIIKSYLELFF